MNIYGVNIRNNDSSVKRFHGLAVSVQDAIAFCYQAAYEKGHSDFVIEDINMIGTLDFTGPEYIGEFENENRQNPYQG